MTDMIPLEDTDNEQDGSQPNNFEDQPILAKTLLTSVFAAIASC